MSSGVIAGIVVASVVFVLLVVFFVLLPKKYYFSAMFSGAFISGFTLIAMKTRKVDLEDVVSAYIFAKKQKMKILLAELESISVSGGKARRVVEGMNAAKLAKISIDLPFAKAVDVSGLNVLQLVHECVQPKVIELPLTTAVTMDNYEINAKVSLSLKVNLKTYLNGVTDETISARGIEAVVTKIANTEKASTLIAHPEYLDKAIFEAGIDENSKYELVSADVIHIDLGKNRGIDVENAQMEKDHRLSMQKLEERKQEAVAVEQEMKARAEEMRAKAAAQEAEVPKAIIKAIEEGKMQDVVDYYKIQNLMADTELKRNTLKDKKED